MVVRQGPVLVMLLDLSAFCSCFCLRSSDNLRREATSVRRRDALLLGDTGATLGFLEFARFAAEFNLYVLFLDFYLFESALLTLDLLEITAALWLCAVSRTWFFS